MILGSTPVRAAICLMAALAGQSTETARAHHSFAMFDQSKCETVEGTVVKFEMAFPHAWLWAAVPGADGSATVWGFEGADPTSLRLRGWSTSVIKKGDKIQIAFSPLRDGRSGGSFAQVRLAEGTILSSPRVSFAGGLKVCEVPGGEGR